MTVRFGVDAQFEPDVPGQDHDGAPEPDDSVERGDAHHGGGSQQRDLRLKPGMTASMRIEVSRRDNVMRIPNAALRFRPNNDMYARSAGAADAGARGRSGRHRRADRGRRYTDCDPCGINARVSGCAQASNRRTGRQRHSHRLRRPTAEATGSATATRAGPILSRAAVSAPAAAEVGAAAAG